MKVNTDTGIISAQGYMEEELSNELRPLVKSMLQKDIVTRKQLKKEFHIDYKTVRKLVIDGVKISMGSILKFNYAIAYYLNEELNKQKSKANKEKVDEVHVSEVKKLDKGYRKLYGIQATIVDELIAKGVDLRTLKL